MDETTDNAAGLEYTSTHPSNATRVEKIKGILPWALDIRLQCKCSALPQNQAADLTRIPYEKVLRSLTYPGN